MKIKSFVFVLLQYLVFVHINSLLIQGFSYIINNKRGNVHLYMYDNELLKQAKVYASVAIVSFPLLVGGIDNVDAKIQLPKLTKITNEIISPQSPAFQLARQKRTAAIKAMQEKGILKIYTDDTGNQFLNVPWIPNQKILYKSIPFNTRLWNELCAGALGEISKDVLLHAVDTAKTRRQAKKKSSNSLIQSPTKTYFNQSYEISSAISLPVEKSMNPIEKIKDLYSGFPIVLASSIPQGGAFFLVKKGCIELISRYLPNLPSFVSSTIPIGAGVIVYWLFRTPAEVIKTQVQTKQTSNITESLLLAKNNPMNGYLSLWKYYPVVLSLDIPFQIINFILFSIFNDYITTAGFEQTIVTRLVCGITCGMIAAGLTCPLDVCKTRIISRDKENNMNIENVNKNINKNMIIELYSIFKNEGLKCLFLGLGQRLLYTGLANGIRLSAYGTSRMDLMMKSLDSL